MSPEYDLLDLCPEAQEQDAQEPGVECQACYEAVIPERDAVLSRCEQCRKPLCKSCVRTDDCLPWCADCLPKWQAEKNALPKCWECELPIFGTPIVLFKQPYCQTCAGTGAMMRNALAQLPAELPASKGWAA